MKRKILVKPPLKETYINNANNEKVSYINLPEEYKEYSLEEDIKQGGIHLKNLFGLTGKKNISRVISITADSVEMGLMSVAYLAMNIAERRGGYEEQLSFLSDDDKAWIESDRKIPVITINDLISYMRNDALPFEDHGYLVAQAHQREKRKPYWSQCLYYSVCIIVDRVSADSTCLNYINMFFRNKNVYVVFIDKKPFDVEMEGEFPYGFMDSEHFMALRNNFILANASDVVNVSFDKNESLQYYKNIFKQNLSQRNIKVKKGFSYERVVNLARSINKDAVCDMIDKIVVYAIKDMEKPVLCSLGNKDFDFVDQFIRGNLSNGICDSGKILMEKNLVGMDDIKQQVYDIVNVMKYNKIRSQMNIPGSSFHNVHVMLGAPGTAKTTVARYMGQMMFDEKLLPDNRYICINGAELKGMYVGHSAPKTKKLFEDYDVIIIDEAYSIVEENGTTDSFGNEAIAQLIIELENHSTDKLVVFAGYGGDVDEKDNRMQTFIDSNPGIKSRITSTFYFKSYTSKDMVEIFKRIGKNSGYCISNDLDKVVEVFFKKRVSARDFGNGREARVLLETAEVFAAKRVMSLDKEQYSKVDMQTLTLEDIENAIRRMEKSYGKDEKTIRKIGFE